MVEKACRIGRQLRDLGVRPYGVVRIDSATGVHEYAQGSTANMKLIAETFRKACDIAEAYGERRAAAEGGICWGGMHGWKSMVELLEIVGAPEDARFRADIAHTLLYTLGYNAPDERILPEDFDWREPRSLRGRVEIDARAASLDDQIFTSRKTTPPSKARVRMTRPAVTARSTIRTASSISPTTPDTGCATRPARSRRTVQTHLLELVHVPE